MGVSGFIERLCFHRCLSFCSQGSGVADTPLCRHPWQTHPLGRQPLADTPIPVGRHPWADTTPWPDSPLADTPWQIPPGRHPLPGQTPIGQTPPWADTPLGRPPGRHPSGWTQLCDKSLICLFQNTYRQKQVGSSLRLLSKTMSV